jgi:hypothetical protein
MLTTDENGSSEIVVAPSKPSLGGAAAHAPEVQVRQTASAAARARYVPPPDVGASSRRARG